MTASPGDGEHAAREGYYPDPSIPGYVRYWNGAAWVPGTSRPAPAPAPVEETGPVFLDETSATEALPDPGAGPGPGAGAGPRPAATAWQADPAHQAGFGGPRDVRVSWGGPDLGEPEDARPAGISLARPAAAAPAARRLPAQAAAESVGILSARPPAWPDAPATGVSGLTSSWPEAAAAPAPPPPGGAEAPSRPGPPAAPEADWPPTPSPAPAGSSARAAGGPAPAWPGESGREWSSAASPSPAAGGSARAAAVRGDERFGPEGAPGPAGRSARAAGSAGAAPGGGSAAGWAGDPGPEGESGRGWASAGSSARAAGLAGDPGPAAAAGGSGRAASRADAGRGPGGAHGRGWADAPAGAAPADSARASGAHPGPEAGAAPAWPAREGASGRAAWSDAPARDGDGSRGPAARAAGPAAHAPAAAHAPSSAPAPAEPGREDARAVFERMAERAVRPAGLVRRGLARVLDSLVLAGVAVAAAAPLVPGVTAHLQAKVDAARASGRTTTVWLLDATTAGRLGLVLAALLLFGVFYEALPTARWGRTPGKKLCGVRVLATATLRPPGFGAALLRMLVYGFLGVPGSLWCLFDRPRRRGWHDRAARTYVSR
ncbi:RDD family protein [Streptomyces sp. NPDC096033]|uniref:RDD family protein n=1 Tax=Streptomyces sp. NPDC096033 TaxID=3366071 RepID=UPI00380018C3